MITEGDSKGSGDRETGREKDLRLNVEKEQKTCHLHQDLRRSEFHIRGQLTWGKGDPEIDRWYGDK